MKRLIPAFIFCFGISGGMGLAADTSRLDSSMFYLGKGREHLRPELMRAAKLVGRHTACREITGGSWGISGVDVDILGKRRMMYRITCIVDDLPNSRADNFWVFQTKLDDSSAIFRQQLSRNIEIVTECRVTFGPTANCDLPRIRKE
jgi:hypothetical protein